MIFFEVYVTFLAIYCLGFIVLAVAWKRIPAKTLNSGNVETHNFSIIVPFRNEEKPLSKLIESLKSVDYFPDHYEVILVDDQSDDSSVEIVRSSISNTSNFTLIYSTSQGKKSAINTGVHAAKYDYIITIDADCVVPVSLLQAYNTRLQLSSYNLISGPVAYQANGFFHNLLNIELMGLVGIGAATLHLGKPTMANGANLCFKKKSYEEVNGFEGVDQIASGDDEFLLRKIHSLNPEKCIFLKDQLAIVKTNPPNDFSEFFNQRVRWSSKWRYQKSVVSALVPIFLVVLYSTQILSLFYVLKYTTFLIMLKLGIEYLLIMQILQFYKKRELILYGIILQIYYPFYILVIGITSLFSKHYFWKKRRVK